MQDVTNMFESKTRGGYPVRFLCKFPEPPASGFQIVGQFLNNHWINNSWTVNGRNNSSHEDEYDLIPKGQTRVRPLRKEDIMPGDLFTRCNDSGKEFLRGWQLLSKNGIFLDGYLIEWDRLQNEWLRCPSGKNPHLPESWEKCQVEEVI